MCTLSDLFNAWTLHVILHSCICNLTECFLYDWIKILLCNMSVWALLVEKQVMEKLYFTTQEGSRSLLHWTLCQFSVQSAVMVLPWPEPQGLDLIFFNFIIVSHPKLDLGDASWLGWFYIYKFCILFYWVTLFVTHMWQSIVPWLSGAMMWLK